MLHLYHNIGLMTYLHSPREARTAPTDETSEPQITPSGVSVKTTDLPL